VAILTEQITKARSGSALQPVHQLMKFTLVERSSSAAPGRRS